MVEISGIRELRGAEDQAAFEHLVSAAFAVEKGASFLDDFPVWDDRHGARTLKIGAFQGRELVATGGLRFGELKGAPDVPVAVLGAVATAASHRRQGLGARLVAELVARADALGVAWTFLFGSEHEFYRRHGFELAGAQLRMPLARLGSTSTGTGTGVVKGWNDSLIPLLRARPSGLAVRDEDRSWISAHRAIEWRRVDGPSGPVAYAAFNRGIDLQGMIHEWGGEPAALRALLGELGREKPELELLGEETLMRALGIPIQGAFREHLCMARARGSVKTPLPDRLWLWGLDSA